MQFSSESPDFLPQTPPRPHQDPAAGYARPPSPSPSPSPLPPPELHIVTRVPVPAPLAANVVDALHRLVPLIEASPHFVDLESRRVAVDDVSADLFFDGRSPDHNAFKPRIKAYVIRQSIPVIPGLWSLTIEVPCVVQTFSAGVRCRASPKGTTVRSIYSVQSTGDGLFELVDDSSIYCSPWVKFFVKWNFVGSHRKTLETLVDETAREQQGHDVYY